MCVCLLVLLAGVGLGVTIVIEVMLSCMAGVRITTTCDDVDGIINGIVDGVNIFFELNNAILHVCAAANLFTTVYFILNIQ